MGSCDIPVGEEVKFLGLIFSKDLTWDRQVEELKKKINLEFVCQKVL